MSAPRAPSLRLDGAHALVTGASRGIGRAATHALAQAGAEVTLVARGAEELEAVAREVREGGGVAFAHTADVTDEAAVEALVAAARGRGLDVLVNAAGTNRTGPTADYAAADFDALVAINLRATFLTCRAAGRGWLADGAAGRIVNVSSQMGSVGYPGRAAYCATKHAVDGLTRALAVEWAPAGIAVNAVAPTFVRTPMVEPMLRDERFREDVLRRLPGGAIGEVEDVMGAVVFLASPAAALVTGHVLAVDGGWTAW